MSERKRSAAAAQLARVSRDASAHHTKGDGKEAWQKAQRDAWTRELGHAPAPAKPKGERALAAQADRAALRAAGSVVKAIAAGKSPGPKRIAEVAKKLDALPRTR